MSITTRTRTRFSHALYFRVYFGKQQQTAVSGPQARLGASDGDARGLRSLGRARQTRATTRPEPSFQRAVPPGDARERDVCTTCGFVDYRNPKVVVGSVAVWVSRRPRL